MESELGPVIAEEQDIEVQLEDVFDYETSEKMTNCALVALFIRRIMAIVVLTRTNVHGSHRIIAFK